jgi:hypothetical protein
MTEPFTNYSVERARLDRAEFADGVKMIARNGYYIAYVCQLLLFRLRKE